MSENKLKLSPRIRRAAEQSSFRANNNDEASSIRRISARETRGKMTPQYLAKASNVVKIKGQSLIKYLSRATHLQLNGRGIRFIDNLHFLNNLQVLYLYDNDIEDMRGFDRVVHLTHLHLQNNNIRVLAGLTNCQKLKKLFLDGNKIQRVQNLESCTMLEELHIANQRLDDGIGSRKELSRELEFDPASLEALQDLKVLNVTGNGINSISILSYLGQLENLQARNNKIVDLEDLQMLFQYARRLKTLDIRENPICNLPKYLERVVIASPPSLRLLDGKEIKMQEKKFLLALYARKERKVKAQKRNNEKRCEFDSGIDDRLVGPSPSIFLPSTQVQHKMGLSVRQMKQHERRRVNRDKRVVRKKNISLGIEGLGLT
eukprot:g5157.t1